MLCCSNIYMYKWEWRWHLATEECMWSGWYEHGISLCLKYWIIHVFSQFRNSRYQVKTIILFKNLFFLSYSFFITIHFLTVHSRSHTYIYLKIRGAIEWRVETVILFSFGLEWHNFRIPSESEYTKQWNNKRITNSSTASQK